MACASGGCFDPSAYRAKLASYTSLLANEDAFNGNCWVYDSIEVSGDIVIGGETVTFTNNPKFTCKTLYLIGIREVRASGFSTTASKTFTIEKIDLFYNHSSKFKALPDKIQKLITQLVKDNGHYDSAYWTMTVKEACAKEEQKSDAPGTKA